MAGMRDGIVKRGATWTYIIREFDPATGGRKQRWVGGFATRAEAVRARDEARVAEHRGESVAASRVTLQMHLESWLERADVKPKTLSGYRYNVERYVIPRIGGLLLQEIRPATLTAFYAGLSRDGGRDGRPLGPSSVQGVHRTLRSALTSAVREQLLHSNPATNATLPPKPAVVAREDREAAEIHAFSAQELQSFLAAAAEHRLSALFHLAAFTGARRGELLHLRWPDIDFDRGRVRIFGTRSVVDGEAIEGTPKSGRARTITIDPATVEVLRTLRTRQAEEEVAAGQLWIGAGHLFTNPVGKPIHPDTPSGLMPKLCQAAGLRHRRFHDLRHTHATILLTTGVPPHEVADRLGHRDATVTLQVYASVLHGRADALGDVFARAMGQAS